MTEVNEDEEFDTRFNLGEPVEVITPEGGVKVVLSERRVLKWTVPVDDQFHPIGSGPVVLAKADVHHFTVWTEEHVTAPPVIRPARVFATGQPVPAGLTHLGSGSAETGAPFPPALVWHLYGGDPK